MEVSATVLEFMDDMLELIDCAPRQGSRFFTENEWAYWYNEIFDKNFFLKICTTDKLHSEKVLVGHISKFFRTDAGPADLDAGIT
jgi:hypothetical protein